MPPSDTLLAPPHDRSAASSSEPGARRAPRVGPRLLLPAVTGPAVILGATASAATAAVLAVALVLAAPTSSRLGRRLVTNLTLLSLVVTTLGWLPGQGLSVHIGLGVLWAWLAWWSARHGWRSAVPRLRWPDAAIALSGLGALGVARPLLGNSPTTDMAVLMGGWDHVGHFSMYLAQREGTDHAVAAGQTWFFVNYPQLFHGFAAGLAELVWGSPGTVSAELVRYSTINAVLFVAMVVAGIALAVDATDDGSRPVRWTAALLVASLYLGFPGASLLVQGYLSLLWSVVAAVVVLQTARRLGPPCTVELVVAAACVVAVAAWPLLLPVVAGPAVQLLLRCWRHGGRLRAWSAVLAGAAGVSCSWLVWVSGRADVGGHIVTAGGIVHTGVVACIAIPAVVLLAAGVGVRRRRATWSPVLWSALGHAALIALVAAYQLSRAGELSYYFWKTALAGQTVLLAAMAPDLARGLVAVARRVTSTPRSAVTLTTIAAAALAVVGLGVAGDRPSVSTAFVARWSLESWASQRDLASEVMAMSGTRARFDRVLWAKESDAYSPALPDQWLHSYTRARTVAVEIHQVDLVNTRYHGTAELARAVQRIVRTSDLTVVVDDPVLYDLVQTGLDGSRRSSVVLVRP